MTVTIRLLPRWSRCSAPKLRALVLLPLLFAGCPGGPTRSPEALAAAYADALTRSDAEAAYALLDAQVQAETPFPEFAERFARQARAAQAARKAPASEKGARAPDGTPAPVSLTGYTAHPGGLRLTWAHHDGEFRVLSGLPAVGGSPTPKAAILAFVRVLRAGPDPRLDDLLDEELDAEQRAEREALAAALFAALDTGTSLHVSRDGERAELRYGENERVRLVFYEDGWRISALR